MPLWTLTEPFCFVSHDRYFINKVATCVLEIAPQVRRFISVTMTIISKKAEQEEIAAAKSTAETPIENSPKEVSTGKVNYQQGKERQKQERRLKRSVEEFEQLVEKLDAQKMTWKIRCPHLKTIMTWKKWANFRQSCRKFPKNSLKQKKTGNKQAWSWKNSWLDQIRLLKPQPFRSLVFLLDETFQLRFFRNFRTEDPTSEFFRIKKGSFPSFGKILFIFKLFMTCFRSNQIQTRIGIKI